MTEVEIAGQARNDGKGRARNDGKGRARDDEEILSNITNNRQLRMKNKKIKVLHFIPGFLFGGIESLFMMWNEKIDPSKFEFELLLRTKEQSIELLDEYAQRGGVYHRLAIFSPKRAFKYIKSVKSFFKEHNDYDIMHAHGADPFVFYYAKKYGIKNIILHAHTTSEGEAKYQLIKKIFKVLSMQLVTCRTACSTLAAEWMFPKRNDVVVIPNSVDIERFKFDDSIRQEYRQELGVENKKVVISVGRLTYQKNYPFVLDIFEQVAKRRDDTVLLIVGDGPDMEMIEGMIKDKGLEESVIMLGRRGDVPNLLQSADMFLMPSHYEGLGIVAIEAQTSGLPILLSTEVPKDVQITDLVQYMALTESAEAWSKKAIDMLKRNTDRAQYYDKVMNTDFNINNSIGMLEKLYTKLAR